MSKEYKYFVERDPKTLTYTVTRKQGRTTVDTVRYIESKSPDKARIKELLIHAKGSDRTMEQFAADCSDKDMVINPPTFSRIMSGTGLKRPLKAKIIQAILNNAADSDFVNTERLMEANGLVREASDDEAQEANPAVVKTPFYGYSLGKNEKAVSDIEKTLDSKDYKSVHYHGDLFRYDGRNVPLTDRTENRYGLPLDFNQVLEVEDKKGRKFLWGFVIDGKDPEDCAQGEWIYYEYKIDLDYDDYVEDDIIDNNGKILLRARIDPDSLKGINISFVCQNRLWYNMAVQAVKDIEVDSYISVVLIQDHEVVSEYTLKNSKGKNPKCILGEFREKDEENRYEESWYDEADGSLQTVWSPPVGY